MFHSLEALAAVARIERVFVVLSPLDRHWSAHDWSDFRKRSRHSSWAVRRAGEVSADALAHLAARVAAEDWILVHDAARPCLATGLVEQFIDEVGDDPVGGLLAMPLADTLKRAEEAGASERDRCRASGSGARRRRRCSATRR